MTDEVHNPAAHGDLGSGPLAAHTLLDRVVGEHEDLNREGLLETPARMYKALGELLDGYGTDPADLLKGFDAEGYDQIVVARDIDFSSLCEHHVLPFIGKVSVAYIPNHQIVGLSKIPRIVRALSRRLQVQERLTQQIANALEPLDPHGVAVVVRAHHMCASLRGVERPTEMVTSVTLGLFRDDPAARAEVMELLR